MAIYHLNVSIGSRGGGQSAAAKLDYIERKGKYAKGSDEVAYIEHGNIPRFATNNPQQYWAAADRYERENGRLFRQVEFALPIELNREQQIALAHKFATTITGKEAMPYTLAIHKGEYDHQGKKTDTPENPHVHLIISERANDGIERNAETWFKRANKQQPEKGGAAKSKSMESRDWLMETRKLWATMANEALERAGKTEKIDHRTLEAQGITDRLPQTHRGVSARMNIRGIATDRNQQRQEKETEAREYQQLTATLTSLSEHEKQIQAEQKARAKQRTNPLQDLEEKINVEKQYINLLFEKIESHQEAIAYHEKRLSAFQEQLNIAQNEQKSLSNRFLAGILYKPKIEEKKSLISRFKGEIEETELLLVAEREQVAALTAQKNSKLEALAKTASDYLELSRQLIAPEFRFDANQYSSLREVGKAAYEAIGGDLRLLPALERELLKQGYVFDRTQIQSTQPAILKDAFGKAVGESRERIQARLNSRKRGERERDDFER